MSRRQAAAPAASADPSTPQPRSLALISQASRALAEARTLDDVRGVRDRAEALRAYLRQQHDSFDLQNDAAEIKLRAERRAGELLAEMEKQRPGEYQRLHDATVAPSLADVGVEKTQSHRWQRMATLPEPMFEGYLSETRKAGKDITTAGALRLLRHSEVTDKLNAIALAPVDESRGTFDVLVIDPPWPMEKIEREVRPNQIGFDYPTMTEEELAAMALPHADDCHVWLWTTHRFLPMAFRLLDAWGLKYVCTFVWHKPGGFQPVGLPQYNCEFALYARRGTPRFTDTKALPTCFDAPRGTHSEKPKEFYDVVCRVTAGRRLDMFNRRPIHGFETWGKEAA